MRSVPNGLLLSLPLLLLLLWSDQATASTDIYMRLYCVKQDNSLSLMNGYKLILNGEYSDWSTNPPRDVTRWIVNPNAEYVYLSESGNAYEKTNSVTFKYDSCDVQKQKCPQFKACDGVSIDYKTVPAVQKAMANGFIYIGLNGAFLTYIDGDHGKRGGWSIINPSDNSITNKEIFDKNWAPPTTPAPATEPKTEATVPANNNADATVAANTDNNTPSGPGPAVQNPDGVESSSSLAFGYLGTCVLAVAGLVRLL